MSFRIGRKSESKPLVICRLVLSMYWLLVILRATLSAPPGKFHDFVAIRVSIWIAVTLKVICSLTYARSSIEYLVVLCILNA